MRYLSKSLKTLQKCSMELSHYEWDKKKIKFSLKKVLK
jgi:hypothetical protein